MSLQQIHNEAAILERISLNDEAAFRELYDFYKPVVYRAALRMTADSEVAQEILQDAFMKVWVHRKKLPEIQNFPGWLFTIYENLMINALLRVARMNKHLEAYKSERTISPADFPGYQVELKQFREIIDRAVQSLPQKQQEAYQLVKVQGLSRQEAAEKMNVHPETIKSNLDHAMKFIRAICIKKLELNKFALLYLFLYFF